jgi:hypothetical protein
MTADVASSSRLTGFSPVQYAICLKGIVWREGLRFLHQRERFVAARARAAAQGMTQHLNPTWLEIMSAEMMRPRK